jgi:hypothetical protein
MFIRNRKRGRVPCRGQLGLGAGKLKHRGFYIYKPYRPRGLDISQPLSPTSQPSEPKATTWCRVHVKTVLCSIALRLRRYAATLRTNGFSHPAVHKLRVDRVLVVAQCPEATGRISLPFGPCCSDIGQKFLISLWVAMLVSLLLTEERRLHPTRFICSRISYPVIPLLLAACSAR